VNASAAAAPPPPTNYYYHYYYYYYCYYYSCCYQAVARMAEDGGKAATMVGKEICTRIESQVNSRSSSVGVVNMTGLTTTLPICHDNTHWQVVDVLRKESEKAAGVLGKLAQDYHDTMKGNMTQVKGALDDVITTYRVSGGGLSPPLRW